jgi:hypothetical protein
LLVLVAVLLLAVIVGGTLFWLAWEQTPGDRHEDLWIDVGGAGLQVGVVAVLGTILSLIVGWLDHRRQGERKDLEDRRERAERKLERDRQEQRRRDEFRLRIFNDLVAGYNQVKAIRRNLRGLGLRRPPGELNAPQAEGLRTQMSELSEAQLSFEALWRELKTNAAAFADPDSIRPHIKTVEEYLHAIVKEWEKAGGAIWAGASGERVKDLARLQAFIGEKTDFEAASTPMRKVQRLVREAIVGHELTHIEEEGETDD